MELNTTRKPTVIDELPFGLYVWEMPNGQWVGDDEGNFLNIAAMKGDVKRISQITDAARSYGITEGRPVFLSGHRQIDDEEYERQRMRMQWGLVPDEEDLPNMMEQLRQQGD